MATQRKTTPERRRATINVVKARIKQARKDLTAAYAAASVVVAATRLHFIGLMIDPWLARVQGDITAAHNERMLVARRNIKLAEGRLQRAERRLDDLKRGRARRV